MKVADLLSDLTQLQFADPEAALALVSARSDTAKSPATNGDNSADRTHEDADLKRAKDLLDLHKSVKLAHPEAEPDQALKTARADVEKVMSEL